MSSDPSPNPSGRFAGYHVRRPNGSWRRGGENEDEVGNRGQDPNEQDIAFIMQHMETTHGHLEEEWPPEELARLQHALERFRDEWFEGDSRNVREFTNAIDNMIAHWHEYPRDWPGYGEGTVQLIARDRDEVLDGRNGIFERIAPSVRWWTDTERDRIPYRVNEMAVHWDREREDVHTFENRVGRMLGELGGEELPPQRPRWQRLFGTDPEREHGLSNATEPAGGVRPGSGRGHTLGRSRVAGDVLQRRAAQERRLLDQRAAERRRQHDMENSNDGPPGQGNDGRY